MLKHAYMHHTSIDLAADMNIHPIIKQKEKWITWHYFNKQQENVNAKSISDELWKGETISSNIYFTPSCDLKEIQAPGLFAYL